MNSQPPPERPLNWLGKLFVALTVVVTFGVAFPVTWWITGNLGWEMYPRILFVIPIVAIGFGFWVGLNIICERLGIELQQSDDCDTVSMFERPADES